MKLFINVSQLVDETTEAEDSDVAGLYQIDFNKDVSTIAVAELAGWALDIFHAHQGIEYLDDFSITVLDENNRIVEVDANYQSGDHADSGDAYKIDTQPVEPDDLQTSN